MARGTPIAALEPGDPRHIGPFRLLGRIGAGGMGVVYLADSADGRRVAVKMIRSELTQDPVIRQRFLREVHAARQVRSPVTAQVLDADAEARPPWVAFEFIDSPNLEEVVDEQLPRLSAAIGILSGIAEALVAIHQAGIIHRDLKPSNILCPPNGVKVIDFGIAAAKESTNLTASGLIGTPAWLSPEQVLGHPLTPAVDVFAWGCVAVYTATGRLPFAGPEDHPAAIYYRIVNTPVDLTGVPRQLTGPVSAALSKDPRDRPPVPALLDMLFPTQAAPRSSAPPPSPPPPPVPPHPTVVVGPPPRRPETPTPALTSGPARRRGLTAAVVVMVLAVIGGAVALLSRGTGGGSGTTTTTTEAPTSTTAGPTTSTTSGSVAPPQPASLPGFTKSGAVVSTIVRVFQGQSGSIISDFPWSMNGCAQRTFTVQWRALGPNAVTAGMTQVEMPPVQLSDLTKPTTALRGLMQGDGCSQPAFFFDTAPPNTLEDVAVAYQVWTASP